jgi:hypothetical protein
VVTATANGTILLSAGDVVRGCAYQTSGAALTLHNSGSYTRINVTKVPAPVINGAAASGVWGAGGLVGSNSLVGDEIYIDTNGQLRVSPEDVFTVLPPSAPITSYPYGSSVMMTNQTDAWPVAVSGVVETIRSSTVNYVGHQIWNRANGKSLLAAYIRQASSDGWSDWWPLAGAGVTPYATAAGVSTLGASIAPNTGVSLAISFPTGRFSVPPIVVASADSNGYGVASGAGATISGVSLRYYNPTTSTHTTCKVHWTAVQMTPTSASG